MIATAILLVAVAIATFTDARYGRIYNWTTYPGLIAAVALNGFVTWRDGPALTANALEFWGAVGWEESLKGLALCGGLMLVSFVLFGIGGGDLKLLALVGAFLGPDSGLIVLLWTFLFGGALGALILIWRVGAVTVIRYVLTRIGVVFGMEPYPLTEAEQKVFRTDLFLAPCAGLAVLLLKLEWLPTI